MTKDDDKRPWMTVKDVARFSQVTERTVRNWIDDDELPASKHGRLVRIHPNDYENFARNRRK